MQNSYKNLIVRIRSPVDIVGLKPCSELGWTFGGQSAIFWSLFNEARETPLQLRLAANLPYNVCSLYNCLLFCPAFQLFTTALDNVTSGWYQWGSSSHIWSMLFFNAFIDAMCVVSAIDKTIDALIGCQPVTVGSGSCSFLSVIPDYAQSQQIFIWLVQCEADTDFLLSRIHWFDFFDVFFDIVWATHRLLANCYQSRAMNGVPQRYLFLFRRYSCSQVKDAGKLGTNINITRLCCTYA